MTSRRTVTIVFDQNFGQRVALLSARGPVWIVESPLNDAAVQACWERDGGADQGEITTFALPPGDVTDALASILETVDEHHGEYAQDPPVDALAIYGVPLSRDVRSVLAACGFKAIDEHSEHFVASK